MPRDTTPTATLPDVPSAILFDLDGTISDSAQAITSAIAEALENRNLPVPDAQTLLRFVGPPIRDGFAQFTTVAEEHLDDLVTEYRAIYRPRMTQAPLFPGITEAIRAWHDAGVPLALATAKLQEMAEPILDAAGLSEYFTIIRGATRQDSETLAGVQVKANVVGSALDGLRQAGVDTSAAVMVGDRDHDVKGAAQHNLPTVLVGWGYAEPGEEKGAAAVAYDVSQLEHLLGSSIGRRRSG